jgi:hypothetical protein
MKELDLFRSKQPKRASRGGWLILSSARFDVFGPRRLMIPLLVFTVE